MLVSAWFTLSLLTMATEAVSRLSKKNGKGHKVHHSSESSLSSSSSGTAKLHRRTRGISKTGRGRDGCSFAEKMVGYTKTKVYGRDGQVKPRPDLPSDDSANEDFCSIM